MDNAAETESSRLKLQYEQLNSDLRTLHCQIAKMIQTHNTLKFKIRLIKLQLSKIDRETVMETIEISEDEEPSSSNS